MSIKFFKNFFLTLFFISFFIGIQVSAQTNSGNSIKATNTPQLNNQTIYNDQEFDDDCPVETALNIVKVSTLCLLTIFLLTLIFSIIKYKKSQNNTKKKKIYKVIVAISIIFLLLVIIFYNLALYVLDSIFQVRKPVIYLYPEKEQTINVQLDYQGKIIADYPKYNETINGWNVTASPNGIIINHEDNQEYSYLFWEGESNAKIDWDLSTGFVVKGIDTREFLRETLAKIGLTPKEYNEFIVYWYPFMMNNKYNLIHFAEEQYTDTAPLHITPEPDSMLRVFMVYKPLSRYFDIEPQTITPFVREGFTVVEWGGTEVK